MADMTDDDLLRIATTLGLPFGMLDHDYCKSMEIEPGTRSYGEVTCDGMVRFARAVIAAAQPAPAVPAVQIGMKASTWETLSSDAQTLILEAGQRAVDKTKARRVTDAAARAAMAPIPLDGSAADNATLRADNSRLQNEVVGPLRERVKVLEDALRRVHDDKSFNCLKVEKTQDFVRAALEASHG